VEGRRRQVEQSGEFLKESFCLGNGIRPGEFMGIPSILSCGICKGMFVTLLIASHLQLQSLLFS
jgi:hypothetical protein